MTESKTLDIAIAADNTSQLEECLDILGSGVFGGLPPRLVPHGRQDDSQHAVASSRSRRGESSIRRLDSPAFPNGRTTSPCRLKGLLPPARRSLAIAYQKGFAVRRPDILPNRARIHNHVWGSRCRQSIGMPYSEFLKVQTALRWIRLSSSLEQRKSPVRSSAGFVRSSSRRAYQSRDSADCLRPPSCWPMLPGLLEGRRHRARRA